MIRRLPAVAAAATLLVIAAGCGGSSSSSGPSITIGAAKTYKLTQFRPSQPVVAGKPTTVSFRIQKPDGTPLTAFRHGPGPHTGVHLIMVRRDLSVIVHRHPPIAKDGTISEVVDFPEPGPYRVVVDAYPQVAPGESASQANFQLFGSLQVKGDYRAKPIGAFESTATVNGYRFTLHGKPKLHAIQAAFLYATVTDPDGKPADFTPWYGALAHAVFFRQGSLDYFHTHICAPNAAGCTSVLGGAKVTGTSATPGKLHIGVLVPVPGTWRLFLQCKVNGHVLTAPFTLTVKP
jgi:hypothetical protein